MCESFNIGKAMDPVAIAHLRARYLDAVASAEMYRGEAQNHLPMRDFYNALAVTYERSAREMKLMLDKVERLSGASEAAA